MFHLDGIARAFGARRDTEAWVSPTRPAITTSDSGPDSRFSRRTNRRLSGPTVPVFRHLRTPSTRCSYMAIAQLADWPLTGPVTPLARTSVPGAAVSSETASRAASR